MNSYADLEIRILEKSDDKGDRGYPVEITFNGNQEFPRGFLDPAAKPQIINAKPQETGERLFEWLLAGSTLQKAWEQARGQQAMRRIRLRIDAAAPELHAIPWELLRDPGNGGAPQDIAAMEATPFSRYLAGQWIPGSPILKRPIRVLVAIANPEGLEEWNLQPVDRDDEWKLIDDVLGADKDKFELIRLPGDCTLEAIEAALRKGVHILHFVGHGAYPKTGNQAVLYLAGENNCVKAATETQVGEMLARRLCDTGTGSDDRLRLVYLSSCQTATRCPGDAFRGLAPRLVASGVPAVIAMQDLVPVAAAHKFSQTFYSALLDHGEIDRAANAARSSLLTAGIRGAGIPVLFMRLRSGQLFGKRGALLGQKPAIFWSSLIASIDKGDCTPILGPGVTAGLLPPPEELAQTLADRHVYPFADTTNLAHVAQFIGTADPTTMREELQKLSIEQFRKRMGLPPFAQPEPETLSAAIQRSDWVNLSHQLFESEIHRQLADLKLPLYLTTNTDNFMSLTLGNARRQAVSWRPPFNKMELDPPASKNNPVVLHLFGTDDGPDPAVLTEDEYLDYLATASHDHDGFLPESVNARLASTVLLFLGYRLQDLDLKVIMRALLAYVDTSRWKRLQVAVQLEASEGDEARDQEVQNYFESCLSESRVKIYWGTTQQFVADLIDRRQMPKNGG